MPKVSYKKNKIFVALFFFIAITSYLYFSTLRNSYTKITSFEECIAAGFKVLPTYPETCKIPGKLFTNQKQKESTSSTTPLEKEYSFSSSTPKDFKNISYFFDGEEIPFQNGIGSIPSSSSRNATTPIEILGAQLLFDINDDKKVDTVFLLSAKPENKKEVESLYLSLALTLNNGFSGSNIMFIDDGAKNPALMYKNGEIYVSYLLQGNKVTKIFLFKNNILEEKVSQ